MPVTGPKSRLGTILHVRNEAWLNAGPSTWAVFSSSNGDIKLPHRVPILPETHEIKLYDVRRCCAGSNELHLAYQVQAAQAVTAGYFGGYSAKMQDIGEKELKRMEET